MSLVIGLTGQTGSGKSTVATCFRKAGFVVVDADAVAADVVKTPSVLSALTNAFGNTILNPDGTLNRRALADCAFASHEKTECLNAITHPPIVDAIRTAIQAAGDRPILLDAPQLFESGCNSLCQKTVAVLAEEDRRRARILSRDNLTAEQADRRLSAQKSDRFYVNQCDSVLYNNGTETELRHMAEQLVSSLLQQERV